jgi:hypothetical protein
MVKTVYKGSNPSAPTNKINNLLIDGTSLPQRGANSPVRCGLVIRRQVLGQDRQVDLLADLNLIGVVQAIGLRNLRIFIGISVEKFAYFGEVVASLDGVRLFVPARGGNLVMKVGIRGIALFDDIPHPFGDYLRRHVSFDVELLPI